jgi:uncharacterized protein YegL
MHPARFRTVATLVLSAIAVAACNDTNPTSPAASASALSAPGSRVSNIINTDPSKAVTATLTTPDVFAPGAASTYSVAVTGSSSAEPLDVIALVDASGSIRPEPFVTLKNALAGMINNFGWSASGNHLAIVEFSTGAKVKYSLASTQNPDLLAAAALGMPYDAGSTYTKTGMQAALTEFTTNGRPGARRVVLLITDGVPNPATAQNPCSLKTSFDAAGVKTVIFGIGADFETAPVTCLVDDATADIRLLSDYTMLTDALDQAIVQAPVAHSVNYSAVVPDGFVVSAPQADAGTTSISGNVLSWSLGDLGATTHTLTFSVTSPAKACGVMSALTSQQLNFSTATEAGQQLAVAGVDATFPACDTTAPVISPTITGTQGANGWYTSDVTVHWNVTDAESGVTTSAGCDDAAVSQDSNGTTYTCAATNGAGLNSTQTVTIKRDAVLPTVTPAIVGTLGATGWYTSDVAISWATTYGVSGAGATTGCTPTTLATDTNAAVYTCTTSSAAGQTATASVTVKRDASAPTIAFAGNAGTYNINQTVAITCQAADAGSGIDAAHTTCANVSGNVFALGIGAHTVNATATDLLGNHATASTTFTYVVNCDGIIGLFEQWVAEKSGKPEGTKLNKICVAAAKGNPIAKFIEIAAFAVELNSRAASGLTADKRQVLLQFIRSL